MPSERFARAPHIAGGARVLTFRRYRAPHQDADGAGLDRDRNALEGVNVLIVEDDFIVAYDMQTLREEHGAAIVGPSANLDEARTAIAAHAGSIDVAVLDVNINGQFVFPIAAELRRAGVPFVFVTAYADDERLFPSELKDAPRLAKPVLPNALIGQLKRLRG